ncbi:MAG: hypothetical protein HQL63_02550 [Magnetococcales bacterium]|nr:hypothetical protein [Magnetococcales bacterium]MBF0323248.1 hypothetical protein [Magnetococcales bacterium]
MDIVSIKYADASNDRIMISCASGQDFFTAWPCQTWHRAAIEAWLAVLDEQGQPVNHIAAYMPGNP